MVALYPPLRQLGAREWKQERTLGYLGTAVLGVEEQRHEHWVPRELEPQAGQRQSLKCLPMGRKHGRGVPTPQGFRGATRNMLGQRPAGTPRGTGLVRNGP